MSAGPPQYPPPGQYPPSGQYGYPAPGPRRTNGLAIAALCCGIGIILLGPITGILAIIFGAISLRQINERGEGGRGMAIAGLVLGILSMLFLVLGIALIATSGTSSGG